MAPTLTLYRKLGDYLDRLRIVHRFSQADLERTVRSQITAAGLDCAEGQRVLDRVLTDLRGTAFDFGNDSIHWLLFACFASSSRMSGATARILEIGTYEGQFTAILARLFPDAEIVTVDVPESDPIFRGTYKRADDAEYQRFLTLRSRHLAAPNIRFVQINSAFLLDHIQGPFTTVWIDAGHLYPEIAWDIATAHHLCQPGGFLLCDDVIPRADGPRTDYVSPDSALVLRYFAERTGSTLELFPKRCGFRHAGIQRKRKYVAMMARR